MKYYMLIAFVLVCGLRHVSADSKDRIGGDSVYLDKCSPFSLRSVLKADIENDVARRLKRYAEWLEQRKKPCAQILDEVKKRYIFYVDTAIYSITSSAVSQSSVSGTGLDVTMYVSMLCPACKYIYSDLQDSIRLNKKWRFVRIRLRTFSTTRYEHALEAAGFWNKKEELFSAVCMYKDGINENILYHITDSLGIPRTELLQKMSSREIKAAVAASHEEGVKNGVTVTPSFFVNNKKHRGYKDAVWILDAAEFEYGKMKK